MRKSDINQKNRRSASSAPLRGKTALARVSSSALLLFLATLFLLAACASEKPQAETAAAGREVTDDLGRKIRIPEKIDRIVSLAPSVTESIFAVGAGDRLVGVTSFCNYPAETEEIRKIGDTISPNMEAIIALRPQIVFVSTASQVENFARTLEEQGINVFVTDPKSLDDVLKNLLHLGDVLGTGRQAQSLVDELKKRISRVEENVRGAEPVTVFVQISKEPLFTVGQDSFLTEIVRRAGGVSVTAGIPTAYPNLSKETALAYNPAAIILSDSDDNPAPNDVFKNSQAVRGGRVYRINADLLSRPGPRLVDALEQMAGYLHPEKVK